MSGFGSTRRVVIKVGVVGLIGVTAVVVAGLIAGYRPVIITSGSMGDAAPAGSVVIASPAGSVEVGDVLVMRRTGRATITHRVVEIAREDGVGYATTKGDANESRDVEPYRLGNDELVARWTIPHLGSVLSGVNEPVVRFAMVAGATLLLMAVALGRIWLDPEPASSPT